MREILFRAKRKNWQEFPKEEWWVEGYPVKYQPCASKDEWTYGIVPTYASALYIIEIDPETLCQYIYMNDKNGKRIWENDIVKCNKRKDGFEFYKVLWRKYYADFGVEPLEFGIQYPIGLGENEQDIKGCNYEVIGNIFDNPELLKGDQSCTDL